MYLSSQCIADSLHTSHTIKERPSRNRAVNGSSYLVFNKTKEGEMNETKDEPVDKEAKGKESKLDLDTILVEEIGQFGCYQRRALALVALVALMGGYSSNSFVFTAARIPTRSACSCEPALL